MQQGSLVTPRWSEAEIMKRLEVKSPKWLMNSIVDLPKWRQIYTVKYVGPLDGVPPAISVQHCEIEELVIFRFDCGKCNVLHEVGLPPDFYVEVDPPAHSVMDEVSKILAEAKCPA